MSRPSKLTVASLIEQLKALPPEVPVVLEINQGMGPEIVDAASFRLLDAALQNGLVPLQSMLRLASLANRLLEAPDAGVHTGKRIFGLLRFQRRDDGTLAFQDLGGRGQPRRERGVRLVHPRALRFARQPFGLCYRRLLLGGSAGECVAKRGPLLRER